MHVSQRNARRAGYRGAYLDFGGRPAPRRGGILIFISIEFETRVRMYMRLRHAAIGDYREACLSHVTPQQLEPWHAPIASGVGIAPRSSVRHACDRRPPVIHDYDVALRRRTCPPLSASLSATRVATAHEPGSARRKMAEPQRLERRQRVIAKR